jgi:hypothetical protein
VSTYAVARVAGVFARPLCAAVALALSLMCAVLGAAASTAPMTVMSISDISGMTDAAGVAGASNMNDMGEAAVAAASAPVAAMTAELVSEMARDGGPAMASMCATPCVTDIASACTVAAGLTVIAILALFLASRRDTFMGLLARTGPVLYVRRRLRDRTPWTVLSLSLLCVLRV